MQPVTLCECVLKCWRSFPLSNISLYGTCLNPRTSFIAEEALMWVVADCVYHLGQLSWLDQNRIHKCFTLTVNAQKGQNFSLTDLHTLDTSGSNQNHNQFFWPGFCRKARLSWAFFLSTTNSTCVMPPFSLILLELFLPLRLSFKSCLLLLCYYCYLWL